MAYEALAVTSPCSWAVETAIPARWCIQRLAPSQMAASTATTAMAMSASMSVKPTV